MLKGTPSDLYSEYYHPDLRKYSHDPSWFTFQQQKNTQPIKKASPIE